MPATLGIAADYKIPDNKITVTHTTYAGTADSVPHSLKYEVDKRHAAASGGRFTVQDMVFELPVVECANEPAEKDKITDDASVVWRILSVRKIVFDTIYQCVGRRER